MTTYTPYNIEDVSDKYYQSVDDIRVNLGVLCFFTLYETDPKTFEDCKNIPLWDLAHSDYRIRSQTFRIEKDSDGSNTVNNETDLVIDIQKIRQW